MKEIKTYLPEELVDRLSIEAKEKGVHRSELIRERLSQPPNHYGLTTSDFHKAVTKVRRRSSYGLDRQQAESIVATVFNELFSLQRWRLKTFSFTIVRSLMNTAR